MDMFVISFLVILPLVGGNFLEIPEDATVCAGEQFNFTWNYETANFFAVEWKFNGNLMLLYIPSQPPGSQYTYQNGYSSARLNHISNGKVSLSSLAIADTGNYSCEITYSSGSPNIFTDVMSFTVLNLLSSNLACTYNITTDEISCSCPSGISSLTINGIVFACSSFPVKGLAHSEYTVCVVYSCIATGIQKCTNFAGQSTIQSCQNGDGCWIVNIIDKIIFVIIFVLVDFYCDGIYKKYFRLEQLVIRRNSKPVEIVSLNMFVDGRKIAKDLRYIHTHGHAVHCDVTFDKMGRYQCDVTSDNQENLEFYFNFKGFKNEKNVATFIEVENKIKLNGNTLSVQWILKEELTCNSKTFISYQSKTLLGDELEINIVISFDFKGKWCWICNIIDKIIFALSSRCGRIYEKYFRLEQLLVRCNSKPVNIKAFKMVVDDSDLKKNDLRYVYNHGHAVHCDVTFDKTTCYHCAVTLDNQENLAFSFNFTGCEIKKNVATFIEVKNEIKQNGEPIKGQWILKEELTCNSKTFISYQFKTSRADALEIDIVLSFDFNREEEIDDKEEVVICQEVKRHIRSLMILCCIIALLVGIITGVLKHYKVDGFCCMCWVIPVAIIVSLLVAPLFYILLLILVVKKVHGCCIMNNRVGHMDSMLLEECGNQTSRYIGNSLLDKKPNNHSSPHLMQVDSIYNSLPLGKGGTLKPIETPDNTATKTRKKKKNKKKENSEQDLNDKKDGLEDKMSI